jgi:DHA1 family bicyclomycin/chloramphenicol resistance-like MFS transporter
MALLGLSIYFIGTGIIIFANNIEVFCLARVVQGCGGGILSFMVKMILHRNDKSTELNMAFSTMEMIGVLTPALSPLISGFLLDVLVWQELFIVLLLYIAFASCFIFLKLQNFKEKREILFFSSYTGLLKNRLYVINLFKILLAYLPILVCLSSLSFIFQGFFKVSPKQFGLLMLFPVIFLFFGSYSSKIANKHNL